MKKTLLLFVLILSLCLSSCSLGLGQTQQPPVDPDTNETEKVPGYSDEESKIILTTYNEAKSLGFNGTLNEFLELVKGADGLNGLDGVDGKTPTIEISVDGFWVINGIKLTVKASCDCNVEYHIVTFDSKGGSPVPAQQVKHGEKVKRPDDPTMIGYVFLGWYVAEYNEMWSMIGYTVTEDIILSAAWLECPHNDNINSETCGICGARVSHNCVDYNYDYVCDICGARVSHNCVDYDYDYICDLCGEEIITEHTCIDNGTGVCGICFRPIEISKCDQCIDSLDSNGICDVCHRETNCYCEDNDRDEFCDYCGSYVPWEEDEIEYPWDKTTLRVQLTENTNSQELISVSRKYLAGDFDTPDTIAEAARTRNLKAANASKVAIIYSYYPDTADFGWGRNIERITQTNNSGTDVPDIYTNFVYDMVGASLKDNFANLLANNVSATRTANYFEFLKADYNAAANDEGFMYDYMQSLTLAPAKKMYVLSSDYFIDMVRAFFCIPVSVKLMEDYGAYVVAQDADGNIVYDGGDRDGNGTYNFDDFYKLVTDGDWTYDVLAKFSATVWDPSASNMGGCVLGDDIVGFAMSSGGLAASGLLYSSSVEFINKTKYADGTYSYDYPSDNKDFYAFCDATTKLFGESQGIVYVKAGFSEFGDTALLAIRSRFSQNRVLFGDVMTIGGLEFYEYQDMKFGGGFGIVPVPVYRAGDAYKTSIHNTGICGAISRVTENFSQCTAYLNALSTTSDKVLNNYYEYKLQYDLGQGSDGTVEMLKDMRDSVGSDLDKVIEDALYAFNRGENGTGTENRWHYILARYGFQVDIRDEYAGRYDAKEALLDDLANAFQSFRD